MRLRGQVHDCVWLEPGKHGADTRLVGDIGLDEFIAAVAGDSQQRLQVARVGQLVEVEHLMIGVIDQVTNQGRADETGAAGDENAHVRVPVWKAYCQERSLLAGIACGKS